IAEAEKRPAARVRLIALHQRAPLRGGHRAGAGIRQQIDHHVFGAQQEDVVTRSFERALALLRGCEANRLDGLDAEGLDVHAATDAYLAEIPPSARARSDAYFEGGYWLILWDFLYGALIALILLHFRWSAAMRNLAERLTPFGPLRTALYWIQYLLVITIL